MGLKWQTSASHETSTEFPELDNMLPRYDSQTAHDKLLVEAGHIPDLETRNQAAVAKPPAQIHGNPRMLEALHIPSFKLAGLTGFPGQMMHQKTRRQGVTL